MIYSVKGELVHMEQNLAVVECGGVGYACRTTANTLSSLRTGETVKLFTYLNVREDSVELFGFADTAELNCFKMLLSVSGVGAKSALSILSIMSPQGFALCVAGGDAKMLSKAQGIGSKTAQRIVLELKDKVGREVTEMNAADYASGISAPVQMGNNYNEALSALTVLGFSSSQAIKALDGLDENMPVGELVKNALKRLSG